MSKAAIIGCGNMGYALLCGIIKTKRYDLKDITVSDKSVICLERAAKLGVNAVSAPVSAAKGAELVILAVKPNALDGLVGELAGSIESNAVIASIIAGKTISTLEGYFGAEAKIIRIMPNTPALVGEGMSGVCANLNVSGDELEAMLSILGGFGKAKAVDESLMDAVTGISGSGPAYAFMFIDGLMKAGVNNGLTEDDAKLLAAQTVLGAAKMVLESDSSPEQLKINVCSPGGTTIEAVKVFEERRLYDIIDEAVKACVEKSRLMSGK